MATKKKTAATKKKRSAPNTTSAKRSTSRTISRKGASSRRSAADRTSSRSATTRGKSRSKSASRSKSKSASGSNRSGASSLVNRLTRAAGDLEKFQEQLAKGKTVAQEKYEELKKALNDEMLAAQKKFKTGDGKKSSGLHTDFRKLQEQLAHGKAETLEAFTAQKRRIFRAVDKLNAQLPGAGIADELREKLHDEMEKFRIKMDLLKEYYDTGKKVVQERIEEKKHDIEDAIAKAKERYETTRDKLSKVKTGGQRELKEAYKHLRKAFVVS